MASGSINERIDVAREVADGVLLEGLPAEARPVGHGALIGSALARELEIERGDELAVLGTSADGSMANDLVTVTGVLRTPVDRINRTGLLLPI